MSAKTRPVPSTSAHAAVPFGPVDGVGGAVVVVVDGVAPAGVAPAAAVPPAVADPVGPGPAGAVAGPRPPASAR